MPDPITIAIAVMTIYAFATGVFLISENRRPQSTLAWLLAFIFLPVVGVFAYLFFGRASKAFSRQRKLLMQELEPNAGPLLSPVLSRQDDVFGWVERQGSTYRRLMMMVKRNSRSAITARNAVEILQDASQFYARLKDDIERAQHSIHLQYFIWRSDEFTEQLLEILAAKAQAGVEVRLLYDPVGSLSTRRAYFRKLRAAGIHAAPTSPLYLLHTISYRNHRKITVIDGIIGYTGGMNIGHEHLDGGIAFDSWRDTQLRITGDATSILQAVFMVDWYNATKEGLFLAKYFPVDAPVSDKGSVPLQILPSGPDSQWSAIRQLYVAMIAAAEDHVYLQSPYFILDASLADALRSAALGGVDVKVMLSARESGNPLPTWAGNTYIADVVQAGVQVFLYQKGYLHAKTVSIDSKICSIGSANIDIRSFSINYELNAVLYCSELASKLEADFKRDLADCTEFNVDEYWRRSVAILFRDSVARLLSPLL